jgi:hypothetical protein
VFNLVIWSFVVALIPVVVGSVWRLVAGLLHWITLGLSRALENAEPWGISHSLRLDPPSGCIEMARRASRPVSRS